ncbi:MAG: acyl-CoA mutase large subunit family protein [Bacteroidales bacterium]|nr:acyl-CoA mutase large subunit family protein [Bacteroidales bacterium]
MDKEKLFNEFPPVSTEQWESKINADLKGADYYKKLVWKTLEGFPVNPYYRQEDLKKLDYLNVPVNTFPYVRAIKEDNNWIVRQDVKISNIDVANSTAYEALFKGADAVGFIGSGEVITNQAAFNRLLRGIHLNKKEVNFISGHAGPDFLSMLVNYAEDYNFDKKQVRGSLDFDPIRFLNANGRFYYDSSERALQRVTRVINFGKEHLPLFRVLSVNGHYFNNAGATAVQELAFALSVGTEYLSKLTYDKVNIDDIAPRMQFIFGVGSNYFLEIAKFRAARLLWAHIVKAFNPANEDTCKMFIHAETTTWNKTAYDPHVNMLRVTTEAMSSAIAGVDSLSVKSYDNIFAESDDFSNRIARNVQLVLKEESHFDKVTDPAAGSYYVENLTNLIAKEAWNLFLKVEEKGGYIAAFTQGYIQDALEETALQRDINIATRKEILLGTNQFPNFSEKLDEKAKVRKMFKTRVTKKNIIERPLYMYRGSEAFEKLRLSVDKAEKTPVAFMLTFGNLAMRRARAQFAANFFACAGFEIVDNIGFNSIEDGVKAAFKKKADIVVLCSADDDYASAAKETLDLLNDKAILVVAGAPSFMEDLKAQGVNNFINVKSNVLHELQGYCEQLNIN